MEYKWRTTPDGTYTIAQITVLGKSAGTSAGHVGGSTVTTDSAYSQLAIPLNGDFGGAGGTPDGFVNSGDIAGFISALSNPSAYQTATGINPSFIGDFNNDGFFNSGDIAGFIQILSAAGPLPAGEISELQALVPEPASFAMIGVALFGMAARCRRTV